MLAESSLSLCRQSATNNCASHCSSPECRYLLEIHRVESEEIKRERDRRDRVKEFKRRQLKLLQKRSDVDIFSNGFQISETFVQK